MLPCMMTTWPDLNQFSIRGMDLAQFFKIATTSQELFWFSLDIVLQFLDKW